MDRYRKYCGEVADMVKGGNKSIEDIKTFVRNQIVFHALDKNKYIPTLISYLESSMGIWDRGYFDMFGLRHELSELMNVQQPDPEYVLRQRLSTILDEKQLTLLLSQLPTIKCVDLKRFWYVRYGIEGVMSAKEFFDLCRAVVPRREGTRGWNYNNFKSF